MQTGRGCRWRDLGVALAVGSGGAAVIWALGAPELSWLGYVPASASFSGRGWRRRGGCWHRDGGGGGAT